MSGNLYTDVERSMVRHIMDAMFAKGWCEKDPSDPFKYINFKYPVFNNVVSKQDWPDQHACLSFMKVSDVPNYEMGGGPKAVLRTPVDPDPVTGAFTHNTVEDWPDAYDLLYQVNVNADTLEAARDLDQLLRDVFRPKHPMYLWDSINKVWSDSYCYYRYAGYINRDIPEQQEYWRVNNMRFEVYNFVENPRTEPVILQPGLEFDIQTKP